MLTSQLDKSDIIAKSKYILKYNIQSISNITFKQINVYKMSLKNKNFLIIMKRNYKKKEVLILKKKKVLILKTE